MASERQKRQDLRSFSCYNSPSWLGHDYFRRTARYQYLYTLHPRLREQYLLANAELQNSVCHWTPHSPVAAEGELELKHSDRCTTVVCRTCLATKGVCVGPILGALCGRTRMQDHITCMQLFTLKGPASAEWPDHDTLFRVQMHRKNDEVIDPGGGVRALGSRPHGLGRSICIQRSSGT
jgi:hypothetical protein